jgi:hypothetical protein
MNWTLVLALVALILALVHELRAEGKSDLGWAVVILALIPLVAEMHL